jgi:phosphatidate cytidylyltransferase
MLRTRVLTAVILAPAALYVILGMSVEAFVVLATALLLVGCWEFRRLSNIDNGIAGWLLILIQAAVMMAVILRPQAWEQALWPLLAACFAWLLLFLRLPLYRPGIQVDTAYRLTGFISALVVISAGWFALIWLRQQQHGAWWLMTLLILVWAADIGAYFSGRTFGKRKLAPLISPGKTWAGLVGGLLVSVLAGMAAINYFPGLPGISLNFVFLSVITVIVSACGDLFISIHKRSVGVKDSGSLFPGHGGVLDRLDSLLASAPFFALGLLLMDLQ